MSKYLGIDWGEKRIGLALGDDETKMASPFKVAVDVNEVVRVIKEEGIEAIVLGVPYSIANSQFPIANEFKKFQKNLEEMTGLVIKLIDERMSSKAADALIGDKKTKAPRDAIAAMIILQSYFDSECE